MEKIVTQDVWLEGEVKDKVPSEIGIFHELDGFHIRLGDVPPTFWLVKHENMVVLTKEQYDLLIMALKKIEQMSDCGSYFNAIVQMKSIATDALNKFNT